MRDEITIYEDNDLLIELFIMGFLLRTVPFVSERCIFDGSIFHVSPCLDDYKNARSMDDISRHSGDPGFTSKKLFEKVYLHVHITDDTLHHFVLTISLMVGKNEYVHAVRVLGNSV